MGTVNGWNELAAQLGVDSIRSSTAAGSGHPTSSLSAAHLVAVLWSDHLRYDVADPKSLANDRFVLSKGHASPLIFSVLKAVGAIGDEQLLSFRRFGSPVQGHPVPLPEMPWIDVATGSLGQGLPIALGMALAMKMDGIPARVWCLMGDSEVAEGSVWEAMENASHHGADNLIAIIDVNRLGQRGPTMLQWDVETYAARARSFGWHPIEVDGHDVAAIDAAFTEAEGSDGPAIVIAKTEKGHGVSFLANQEGWHGKALSQEEADRAIAELGGPRDVSVTPRKPEAGVSPPADVPNVVLPVYAEAIATRKAFGETLAALAVRGDVVAIDGEVVELDPHRGPPEGRARPLRRELHRRAEHAGDGGRHAGAGQGGVPGHVRRLLHARLRLHPDGRDQPREPAPERLSRGRLDRRGRPVADGARGPGDDARRPRLDRALPVRRQLDRAARRGDGRPAGDLVHPDDPREDRRRSTTSDEAFPIGGSKTLRSSDADRVTLVAAGITVHEALGAARSLEAEGIAARVVDCYTVKPIDADTLRAAASRRPVCSSRSRTTGSKGASATPCSRRSRTAATSRAGWSRSR